MTQNDISSASSSEEIKISTDLDIQTIDEVVRLEWQGPSEELVVYDSIRANIKHNGNSLKADITKYNRLQTNLQTKILSKKSDLKSMISNFEREYYKRLPHTTDSEDYSQKLKLTSCHHLNLYTRMHNVYASLILYLFTADETFEAKKSRFSNMWNSTYTHIAITTSLN